MKIHATLLPILKPLSPKMASNMAHYNLTFLPNTLVKYQTSSFYDFHANCIQNFEPSHLHKFAQANMVLLVIPVVTKCVLFIGIRAY